MYKDKDKQREANRKASQRRRDKLKGVTPEEVKAGFVIPYTKPRVIPNDTVVIPIKGGAVIMQVKDRVGPITQSYNPMMVGYVPPKD